MHPITDTGGASVPAFLAKLWRLVEDPETNHLICWSTDGRSFIILNQAQFARELLPLNYKHNNMASFIRQLNMYGFHKITSLDNGGLKFDRDEMEFSHPCFQRGHPFMLENIKRKIAHTRNQPEDKTVATTSQTAAVVKPETLNRVLTEVKMMRGKQEVLDNRFSAMKQENEALWREVVMLRQKHMKQQQIVNKLIQFLVTIVQPSGRGNMGMKRRLPLMLNDAPSASKSRKTGDYGLEISALVDSEEDDDDAYLDLMSMDDTPIVLQSKIGSASSSSRGMISEMPNTPSSTRSHHDDLDDLDEIIEEEAPEADVNKIFEELSEATNNGQKSKKAPVNGNKTATAAVVVSAVQAPTQPPPAAVVVAAAPIVAENHSTEIDEFLKFNDNSTAPGSSTDDGQRSAAAAPVPAKTWYANKDGFISAEIPSELFEDQSQSSMAGGAAAAVVVGLQDSNVNPTLTEDISKKVDEETAGGGGSGGGAKKASKFNGKHLQLARLPSNSGDVFSLATPEDFTLHLDSVQTDLNALKGILSTDALAYDPTQLVGQQQQQQPGTGLSPGGSMGFNPSMLLSLVDNDYMPKMFDESNMMIPYQLSGDCLDVAGGSRSDNGNKERTACEKQLLQYNPTLDFSELLDASLDDSSMVSEGHYLTSTTLDENGSLNTPQPQ